MAEFLQGLSQINWISMLAATLTSATPIVLAALGGILAERSGVTNIALEGIMLTSAYVAYGAGILLGSTFGGLLVAVAAGALIALLHGVLSIKYRTNQVVSGTVINIFALGITGYLYRQFDSNSDLSTFPTINIPVLSQIPVIGEIFFQHQPIVFLMLILVAVVHVVLFRTKWGLRTRAVGEHPKAAATVGVDVNRMRYINVMLSGVLAGIGGAWLIVEAVGRFTPNMTTGRGFIGLAAMIFGNWSPIGALGASLLFTIPEAIQVKLQLLGVPIPYQFLTMLPYLLTILVLTGFGRRSTAPAALGNPYP
jgi:general nucleoside transport system permease protein